MLVTVKEQAAVSARRSRGHWTQRARCMPGASREARPTAKHMSRTSTERVSSIARLKGGKRTTGQVMSQLNLIMCPGRMGEAQSQPKKYRQRTVRNQN